MFGDPLLFALPFLAAVGSGLIAGVFFAFSTFIMRALAKLPAHEGIAAMQSINVVVLNPLFLGTFVGTALLGLLGAAGAVVRWDRPGAAWTLAGALLYAIGTFGVTIACNVPMNNALAALPPADADVAKYWAHYVSRWTMWNTVRTIAALAAMVSFVMALRS